MRGAGSGTAWGGGQATGAGTAPGGFCVCCIAAISAFNSWICFCVDSSNSRSFFCSSWRSGVCAWPAAVAIVQVNAKHHFVAAITPHLRATMKTVPHTHE